MKPRICVSILLLILSGVAGAANWKPVEPELLKLKTPKVDPGADAEAIFWEVTVDDYAQGGYAMHRVHNYLRMKIYNKRGIDQYGTVEIPYFSEARMSLPDVSARTIQPDGTVVEVKSNQIFDTTAEKTGRRKVQVKKFAFPGLEEGAVVEYQWTELYNEFLARYVKLVMQREIPVWETTYYVKPLQHPGFAGRMHSYPFNCKPSKWVPVTGDVRLREFVMTKLENIPALKVEPFMPSKDEVQAWMLLYYTEEGTDRMDKYWKKVGGQAYDDFKKQVKVSGEMKSTAMEVTQGLDGAMNKAAALCNWVQGNIQNVRYMANGMTNEKRTEFYKKPDRNQNSADTFKNRIGTPNQILAVFAGMLQAVGIDPLIVRAGSSGAASFRTDLLDPYLLDSRLVAVKNGDKYTYYNPGVPYLRPGMADWDEQGQAALVADGKDVKLGIVAPSEPGMSEVDRRAKLVLDEEGTAKGNVVMFYSGHLAVQKKLELQTMTPGEREEYTKKDLEQEFPGSQVSAVKVENANTVGTMLRIEFEITQQNYGQRTGKRMFFPTSFFHATDRPKLTAAKREHPIYFPFAYSEKEVVEISYPEGMELENAEMPGPLALGGVGKYSHSAGLMKNQPGIVSRRTLEWGTGGATAFEAKNYAALKQAWDLIQKADTHSLTLRSKK